jgi:tetratricopeptide (TPR) repeat protein
MRIKLTASFIFLTFIAAISVNSQHHEPSGGKAPGGDLGEISFPTSGSAEAQKHFIQGVLLLHSFEYPAARAAFVEASKADPSFAIAYWGEAMTHDHRIWGEQDQPSAVAALARLAPTRAERRAKAATEREKMYMDAVEELFSEGTEAEVASRYSKAMEAITIKFPDDLEARAFYSLSILGLTGATRNTENYMRAAAVAEEIYAKNPKHPGALHYLIHAYDDPVHAPLGLRAARVYGTVARGASHAQHMPSHIFFALGMWEDAIVANTDSMKTARDAGGGGYHPLHWLQHAYLQIGRDDEAAKLLAVVEDDMKHTPTNNGRMHLAMCRATMLVETRGKGPASIMEPVDPAGIRSFGVFSSHDMAMGLEYVRRNDIAAARRMLGSIKQRLETAKTATSEAGGVSSRYTTISQTEIAAGAVMEQILDAAIVFASGERDAAIKQIIAAGEAEDGLVFEYGPPAIVKPAWEAAGEMLLAAGRKAEAADAFRKVLKRYPNRRLSSEGLRIAGN